VKKKSKDLKKLTLRKAEKSSYFLVYKSGTLLYNILNTKGGKHMEYWDDFDCEVQCEEVYEGDGYDYESVSEEV